MYRKHTSLSVLFSVLLLGALLQACTRKADNKELEIVEVKDTDAFDEALAKKFGADDYGMKKYVIAFLKRGPNRDLPKEEADKLQAAHMANIGKMAEAGKLVLAGPFFGTDDLRGIYVFDVESLEEAKSLTESDPAIAAGSLEMELKEWYGSAALMGVNEVHTRIAKMDP